jgi:hypothetical protein
MPMRSYAARGSRTSAARAVLAAEMREQRVFEIAGGAGIEGR